MAGNAKVGTAYVSVAADLNQFQTELKTGLGKATSNIKSAAAGIAKVGAAAAASIGAATVAIGKQALDAYANYEQLAGGVEKLYGEASDIVMQNASQAWQTAGMSMNQYMEQATSFSAALTKSLGGDTVKAAQQTDVAMRAISDNVNVFGSNMQDVQNAFQGFAKQNYTMLDNLKLGYGGTKTEMEKLIVDANEYAKANGQAANLSIDSFSDIVTAIELIQEKQNIAGTTAKEAATTIEGSVNAAKSAWENFLAGLGDDNADMEQLTDNLVSSVETAAKNIVPRLGVIVGNIANNIPSLLSDLSSEVAAYAPTITQGIVDAFANVGIDIEPLLSGISSLVSDMVTGIQGFITNMTSTLEENGITEIIQESVDNIGSIATVVGQVAGLVLPILGNIMAFTITMFASIVRGATGLISTVASIPGKIVGFLSSLPSRVGAIFSNVMKSANDKFNGIVSAVSSIPGKIVGYFSGIGSKITSAIGSIHFPTPHVTWESLKVGNVNLGNVLPHVSWYAKGGVFDQPSVIGVGEAGREAVLPLNDSVFRSIADGITANGGGGDTYNVTVNANTSNPEELAEQLIAGIRRYKRVMA